MVCLMVIAVIMASVAGDIDNRTLPGCLMCAECSETAVRCIGLNRTDTLPIVNVFETVSAITYTGSRLERLREPLFTHDLPALEYLDLSGNEVRVVEEARVFARLPGLMQLVLDDNALQLQHRSHYTALRLLAASLERLSLNGAFERGNHVNYNRSLDIDHDVNRLLRLSQLVNVYELRLRRNGLVSFNVPPTVPEKKEVGQSDDEGYVDILCLLPRLRYLFLERNFLEKIAFSVACMRNETTLELLHLEDNKLSSLDAAFVATLRELRARNPTFAVRLQGNPFLCDCELYDFYAFLRDDPASACVHEKKKLMCTHEDSLEATKRRPVIEANLNIYCANVARTTHANKVFYFPTRNKKPFGSTGNSTINSAHGTFTLNKLVVFLLCLFVLNLAFFLLMKYHCRQFWAKRRLNRYTTFGDPLQRARSGSLGNDSLHSFSTGRLNATLPPPSSSAPAAHSSPPSTSLARKVASFLASRRSGGVPQTRLKLDDSGSYQRFEDRSRSASLQSASSKRVIAVKQADGSEDSDKEEETIMDAAVNNIRLKSKPIYQQQSTSSRTSLIEREPLKISVDSAILIPKGPI